MGTNWEDRERDIESRVEGLLSEMTVEEKVAQLCSVGPDRILDENGEFSPEKAGRVLKDGMGQITRIAGASDLEPERAAEAANAVQEYLREETRLGVPAIVHEECLSGFMGRGGTTYPQSIGMASTWEPGLVEEVTGEIKSQMRATGAHLGLSPVLDLAWDMRWGRVEETFGEDPYLVAEMATHYIRGLRGPDPREGVYGTLKHFGGHGVCEGGRNHAPVNVSERTLREHHLFPYEAAVRVGGAKSVMNAYHDLDGVPCAASRMLLTDILRGEWGFDGVVVSDYYSISMLHTDHLVAENSRDAAIRALESGLDIELPDIACYGEPLVEAVREGLISEAVLDEAVRRHLRMKFRLGLFEDRFVDVTRVGDVFETPGQRELARRVARKSMVLLRNEGDLLPLDEDLDSIAIIGPSADSTRNLLGDYAYSAHVDIPEDAVEVVSIREGIENRVGADTEIRYAPGCGIMGESREGFDEAREAAERADVAVVVVGGKSGLSGMRPDEEEEEERDEEVGFARMVYSPSDTTGEHHDRTDLGLTGVQQELVEEIHATGTPVVVILVNGRPLSLPWIAEHIPAVLEAWLPGEEGGNAVADILFGDCNPGGRLPVSIPRSVGQMPVNYNRKPISANRRYVFTEGTPLYPFGYGLSYTDFEYSNLEVSPGIIGPAGRVEVSCRVRNTGDRAGEETVQLYIRDELASLTRPVKELRGFRRLELEPGGEATVSFTLAADQLAFYDESMRLVVESGRFRVMIGRSSEDIRLSGGFRVEGPTKKEVGASRTYFTRTAVER